MQNFLRGFMRRDANRLWAVAGLAMMLPFTQPSSTAHAQTVPAAVVSSSQTLVTLTGNGGHVAVNSLGDVFYVDQGTNIAYELTPGSTTPITIVTGLQYESGSVAVDPSNNLYIPDNGALIEVPFIGGAYTTNVAAGSLNSCSASSPATAPCNQFGGGGSATGYYFQASDLGFDAAGNAYVSAKYLGGGICDGSSGTCNAILEFKAPITSSVNATLIAGGPGKLPNAGSAQLAVDAAGDVLYADDTNLYEVAAGTTGAVVIGTGLKTPGGVGVDSFGNFYVTDTGNNRFVEIPTLNGAPQPAKQFTLSYTYSANGVGVDPQGRLFYTGYSGGTNLNVQTLWNANFGSSPVGTAAAPLTLSVVFNAAATSVSVGVANAAGSGFSLAATQPSRGACAATAYSSGASCAVTVGYTPSAVGLQRSALLISGAGGVPIATGYLSGSGLGAAQTTDPGTVSAIGSGWKTPTGIAVDSAGNVYVADSTTNTVSEYAAGSPTATAIGTGLSKPSGVAVDGAGNVYIGDSGNGRVVEVPAQNGAPASAAQTVVYTGTSGATGLAVDSTGSLLIADSGNAKVSRLVNTNGAPNAGYRAVLGTGFTAPVAVATDSAGDTFVADQTANTVTEIAALTKVQSVVGSGYSHPSGLAVDASGSVYVADPGNFRLIKIPLENGGFNANDAYTVGASVVAPYGVAIDAAFNLYAIDNTNAAVSKIIRTQGTLNLGKANLNTPTSQLNAQIGSAGNLALKFNTPAYTAAGSVSEFTVTVPSSNGCVSADSVSTGFACVLAASFNPTAVGVITDTLSFSNNAANTSTPELVLSGTGENLAATTTVLSPSTSTPALGQAVTITAVVASSATGTPTGSVQFYVNSIASQQGTLNASGQASITLSNLNGGAQTVSATYSGDNNFAPSAAVPITITVAKGSTTTSLSILSSFYNPQSGPVGSSNTLTATVIANGPQAPTQSVSFYAGSTLLGSAPVVAGASYTAQLVTTAVPAGNQTITAVYNGDVNYGPSTSAGVPLIISAPTFTLTPTSSTLTLTSGQSGTIQFSITSVSGYSAVIALTCSGLPADSACSFSPNSFPLIPSSAAGAPTTQTVTGLILTGQTPVIPQPPLTGSLRWPGLSRGLPIGLAFLMLAPLGLRGRRLLKDRFRGAASLLLVLLTLGGMIVGFTGCGSGLIGNTPKGQSTVTVTAYGTVGSGTSSAVTITQTAQITLTVQ